MGGGGRAGEAGCGQKAGHICNLGRAEPEPEPEPEPGAAWDEAGREAGRLRSEQKRDKNNMSL